MCSHPPPPTTIRRQTPPKSVWFITPVTHATNSTNQIKAPLRRTPSSRAHAPDRTKIFLRSPATLLRVGNRRPKFRQPEREQRKMKRTTTRTAIATIIAGYATIISSPSPAAARKAPSTPPNTQTPTPRAQQPPDDWVGTGYPGARRPLVGGSRRKKCDSCQNGCDGGGHPAGDRATEHRAKPQFGEVRASFRSDATDTCYLDRDGAEVRKSAECVHGKAGCAF